MTDCFDVAIIGAGPAGMAAASLLASAGATVCLLDEQPDAGGQIYRSIGGPAQPDKSILGDDYYAGHALYTEFEVSDVRHIKGATVWQVEPSLGEVNYSINNVGHSLMAKRIILATGAQERPMPFPGWTLPGVMPCGAGQIMLKASGVVPACPVVIAGSGPLIFLIAWQFLNAGVEIKAILDTTPRSNKIKGIGQWFSALKGAPYIFKGLKYLAAIRRAGVKVYSEVSQLSANANQDGELGSIGFSHKGITQQIDCELLMVHQGVVPNLQLSRSIGCQHSWDESARNWVVDIDDCGRSSIKNIFVAGDGCAIIGAKAAEHSGRLSAYQILKDLGLFATQTHQVAMIIEQVEYKRHSAIRPFLNAMYCPASEFLAPADETIVCRCEEVSAQDIRGFAELGCMGPNQAKAFGRSGMGPCQGRQCGLAVSELIAEVRGVSPADVGYYNIRAPIKPITLGEIASFAEEGKLSH